MYLNYWGFQAYPYEISPDPKFIFYSRDHEEAMTRLLYAVYRKRGAALLTGEIGCGKTTFSRALIQQFPKHLYKIGLIANPNLNPTDFLLGDSSPVRAQPRYGLQCGPPQHARGDDPAVFQEGGDHPSDHRRSPACAPDTFEKVRLLLNYQLNDQFLLALVLIGQPELRGLIRKIGQLDQRIAVQYHLGPLSFDQTIKCILFRLSKTGLNKNVFTDNARGVPRKINNICDMSLLIGYGMKVSEIDVDVINEAMRGTSCERENGSEGSYILETKSFILPTAAS